MSWKAVLPKASRRTSKILRSTGKSVFCVRKKNSERQLRYRSFLGRKVKNQTSKISFWFVSIQYIFPPCWGHCLSLRINKEFGGLMEDVHYFRYFSFTQGVSCCCIVWPSYYQAGPQQKYTSSKSRKQICIG